MNDRSVRYHSVDEYIAGFPPEVQIILEQIRAVIKKAAPGAIERISYQMPTYTLKGNVVHFAAYKRHIGFYPTPSGIQAFQADLAGYEQSKGAVRFPLDLPMPLDLIEQIVRYRVAEDLARARG